MPVCGILGICSLARGPVDPSRAVAGLDVLRPRGPDDEGFVFIDTESGEASIAGGRDTPRAVYEQRLPYAPTMPVTSVVPGFLIKSSR